MVNTPTMISKVIIPYIIPDILKGLRVSLTTGFLMLMYAESFGAKSGIGYWISNANVFANYANHLRGHHHLRHDGHGAQLLLRLAAEEVHHMALGEWWKEGDRPPITCRMAIRGADPDRRRWQ